MHDLSVSEELAYEDFGEGWPVASLIQGLVIGNSGSASFEE
jgi:hypothetical protein